MDRSEIEEKIRDFGLDEGIIGRKMPENPNVEFAYELNFPPKSPKPMHLLTIKPKETKAIMIQAATQIAPQHVEALAKIDSKGLFKFFDFFKKYLLTQNLLYNIDGNNARYVILDSIYPDGLSEHNFYLSVRKVFNAAVFVNIMLMEMIAGNIPDTKLLGSFDRSDFSGNSMFT